MKPYWQQPALGSHYEFVRVGDTFVEAGSAGGWGHGGSGGASMCRLEDFTRRECEERGCEGSCQVFNTIMCSHGYGVASEVDEAVAAVLASR